MEHNGPVQKIEVAFAWQDSGIMEDEVEHEPYHVHDCVVLIGGRRVAAPRARLWLYTGEDEALHGGSLQLITQAGQAEWLAGANTLLLRQVAVSVLTSLLQFLLTQAVASCVKADGPAPLWEVLERVFVFEEDGSPTSSEDCADLFTEIEQFLQQKRKEDGCE
jgi:hypothetical protein